MKFLCALWLWMFLSEFSSTTGEISKQGYSEGNITITCYHSWASNNRKYFCRDPCGHKDILVKSDQTPTGRYTLKDSGDGTVTVNINDLQESDSGIYWCAVDRIGIDTFVKVKLAVSKANNGNTEEIIHHNTMKTQTSAEMPLTKPTPSVFVSSTTKDNTLLLTPTGFVQTSGPEGKISSSSPHNIFPVPSYYIPYAAACLAILVIICAVGLVTASQCRKRVKKSRCVIASSIYNSRPTEEANDVYENTTDNISYATINKSSNKSQDKSQSDSIYQNLLFDTNQGEAIYGNL
ncbi:hypothetical protein Q8A67_005216 [Cirrhinus molitorella]|uniref:Immunoglobulin V-set domain-containing protein n=1 Tax=Cirrhinus molitorella TaxID=172907 RepID=A0AA88U3X7_9TELE|nr:hypothetical protein Q8A67_005216 [Cirrhinus molitorella]